MDAKPRDERCQQIYDYIVGYHKQTGFAPAYKQIGNHVGLTSKATVHTHTQHLQADGLIVISGSRGAVPVPKEEE